MPELIDIRKVIKNSKSGFLRSMPDFMIRAITRLIHQDEMNETILRNYDKTGMEFVNGVLNDWNVKVIVKNSGNLPESGKFVFVANHPVGAMDALSFLSMIHRFYPDVISPSNELFGYIPQLRPLIVGVNVFGKNTKETAEKLTALFESDSQVMIFPAGEVSRRKKGVISDPAWQKSFITKAIKHQRDIVPVYIKGRNSNLFYFVANFRKKLGIKMYIETALLPREMMLQRNSSVELTIGKPISWETFSNAKTHTEWAAYVKERVYGIASE